MMLRSVLLKIEASWWLMRPNFAIDPLLVAPAGWLAASHPPSNARLWAFGGAALIAGGISHVVNDILDHTKDAQTAPELPIPSGLLSVRYAITECAVLIAVFFGLLALACETRERFTSALVVMCIGGLLTILYSAAKSTPLIAALIAAVAFPAVPIAAWVVAGAGRPVVATLVFLYAASFALGGNLHSTIRDVDSDGEVGNLSVAMVIGAPITLILSALCDAVGLGLVLAIAAATGQTWLVGVVGVAVGAGMGAAYFVGARRIPTVRGRQARVAAFRSATFARLLGPLMLLGVLSYTVAIVVGVAALALLGLAVPAYERRIIGGRLLGDTLAAKSGQHT